MKIISLHTVCPNILTFLPWPKFKSFGNIEGIHLVGYLSITRKMLCSSEYHRISPNPFKNHSLKEVTTTLFIFLVLDKEKAFHDLPHLKRNVLWKYTERSLVERTLYPLSSEPLSCSVQSRKKSTYTWILTYIGSDGPFISYKSLYIPIQKSIPIYVWLNTCYIRK